jgi:hypothetical protein
VRPFPLSLLRAYVCTSISSFSDFSSFDFGFELRSWFCSCSFVLQRFRLRLAGGGVVFYVDGVEHGGCGGVFFFVGGDFFLVLETGADIV